MNISGIQDSTKQSSTEPNGYVPHEEPGENSILRLAFGKEFWEEKSNRLRKTSPFGVHPNWASSIYYCEKWRRFETRTTCCAVDFNF